ncbi:MAG: hypothetical protein DELT_00129 [Desulfovibrio sp.]
MVEYASGLGGKALKAAHGFGQRVFVHLAAVICGLSTWGVTKSPVAGLSVYTGLICLVSRGISITPQWLGPTLAGVVQAAVYLVLGLASLPAAIFWGGAQTWLQRLLLKKLNMGTEWFALLLILPGVIRIFAHSPSKLWLAGLFTAVALVARVVIMAVCADRTAVKVVAHKDEPERVTRHRASLAELAAKLPQLPKSARTVAESIAATTERILECMVRDPNDLEPGHRFLNRYLVAVHSLVDKHIRLARENVITPEIADALAKSEEMLIRLDGVFSKEHEYLLKNDVADFSADLSVIDTLLKMDGREK